MTQTAIKKLAVLRAATIRYAPRVEKRISGAGKNSDSPVVASAAKYYVALKKLANK